MMVVRKLAHVGTLSHTSTLIRTWRDFGLQSIVRVGAALATAAYFAAHANAAPVAPGDIVALSGTTSAAAPDLAGVVQADTTRPFEIRNNLNQVILSGVVQDRVTKSDNLSTMIFAPRLRDLTTPAGTEAWITGIRIEGFGGWSTDIDFRTDGLGDVGPNSVERSSGGGESLFFSHGTNIIVPPQEQRFLSTLTDAPSYTNTGRITIFAQNDFGADVFSTTIAGTYVPATVPEPTASWLGGLAALSLMRLRRR